MKKLLRLLGWPFRIVFRFFKNVFKLIKRGWYYLVTKHHHFKLSGKYNTVFGILKWIVKTIWWLIQQPLIALGDFLADFWNRMKKGPLPTQLRTFWVLQQFVIALGDFFVDLWNRMKQGPPST